MIVPQVTDYEGDHTICNFTVLNIDFVKYNGFHHLL